MSVFRHNRAKIYKKSRPGGESGEPPDRLAARQRI